ncbi:MAG: RNA methyltransferase [Deltaproteobacteria bacterium RIFOXYD12_FULL_50_9]|nr:MAG: RNA methyltransferase [Deltaproteobacteria bacterium RIFOXYD12_FULL_50_9]
MFAYQKTGRYFAQIADGLEEMGVEELTSLGADEVSIVYRGLYFKADSAALYRINYMSRLCSRIMAELLRFDCHSTKYLYKTARGLPWHELLRVDGTFAINATVANSAINHSKYAALCLKDAIVDSFRDRYGVRPNVDTEQPDIWFNLHIDNNLAVINLETSGGSLHRRGYRLASVAAPMQETLAAAIIKLTGWNGEQPLLDPMCGAGTLIGEALMHYCRVPATYLGRHFGFEALPDFDQDLWQTVKSEADAAIRPLPKGLIRASDSAKEAVVAARKNIALLPHGNRVDFSVSRFQDLGRLTDTLIVCNPPYGIRMNQQNDMAVFMKEVGDFLKQKCTGSTAYIYLGRKELLKSVGLKTSWKKPLATGGLAGVLAKYELY